MKAITFVSATLGNLDVVVQEKPNYPNTFKIGNKSIDFSEIVPEYVNLHNLDSYHIIIFDGVEPCVEIIIPREPHNYQGKLSIPSARHEGLVAF